MSCPTCIGTGLDNARIGISGGMMLPVCPTCRGLKESLKTFLVSVEIRDMVDREVTERNYRIEAISDLAAEGEAITRSEGPGVFAEITVCEQVHDAA